VATRRSSGEALPPPERVGRLTISARGFEKLKLTGLLLHRGNRLLYHIEGAEADVRAQHAKIAGDPRVEGVAILRQRTGDSRIFSQWAFAIDEDPRETGTATLADRAAICVKAPPEITQSFSAFAKLDIRKAAA
jgi:hypothetical protein